MKEKTKAVLSELEVMLRKHCQKPEVVQKVLGLYQQAVDLEPDFEDQITMRGQTEALRSLMLKHQDIYQQIKSLRP